MAQVRLSGQSRRDLLTLLEHLTDKAGARVARKYEQLIQKAVVRLRRFPESGSPRPELGEATRIVIVDPYVIFYDWLPEQETALILRILHGRIEMTAGVLARGWR
jgi:plasmid stabilization system protein ParE